MERKSSKKKGNKEEAKKDKSKELVYGASAIDENVAVKKPETRIDFDRFIAYFNRRADELRSNVARIEFLSKGKKARVQYLVNQYGKRILMTACEKLMQSDLLNGRRRGFYFVASFHWMTGSDEVFEKVANGYYDNPRDDQKILPEEALRLLKIEEEKMRAERQRQNRLRELEESERHQKMLDEWRRQAATPAELEKIFANSWINTKKQD